MIAITAAHHHRDRLHRKALLSGCQSDWKLFRDAHNKANGLLRSAKCHYIEELISTHGGHPSKFWSHFGYMSSKGRKPEFTTDFNFHADDLNAHFCLFLGGLYRISLFCQCLQFHISLKLMSHLYVSLLSLRKWLFLQFVDLF